MKRDYIYNIENTELEIGVSGLAVSETCLKFFLSGKSFFAC